MKTEAKNIKAGDIILIYGIKVKVLSTGYTEGSNFISVYNERAEKSLMRTRRNYDRSYSTIPVDAMVETF